MNAGSFGDYRIRLTAQLSLSPAPFLHFCFFREFVAGRENEPRFCRLSSRRRRGLLRILDRAKFCPLRAAARNPHLPDGGFPRISNLPRALPSGAGAVCCGTVFYEGGGFLRSLQKKWSGPPRAGGFSAITPSGRGDCAPRGREVSRFGKTPSYCPMSLERASE